MEDGHAKTVEEVINYFGTDTERGLSLDQIKRNQEKYGPNGMYDRKIYRSVQNHLLIKQEHYLFPCPNHLFPSDGILGRI